MKSSLAQIMAKVYSAIPEHKYPNFLFAYAGRTSIQVTSKVSGMVLQIGVNSSLAGVDTYEFSWTVEGASSKYTASACFSVQSVSRDDFDIMMYITDFA